MTSEQGSVYAGFIYDQLQWERERQASLDDRGSKLQQSVGLTTGLFAAALGALGYGDRSLPGVVLAVFVPAVLLLAAAFFYGVRCTTLVTYEVADHGTLLAMVDDRWDDGVVHSRSITAWLNSTTVKQLRDGNNFKARCLHRAIVFQGLGVIASVVAFISAVIVFALA